MQTTWIVNVFKRYKVALARVALEEDGFWVYFNVDVSLVDLPWHLRKKITRAAIWHAKRSSKWPVCWPFPFKVPVRGVDVRASAILVKPWGL